MDLRRSDFFVGLFVLGTIGVVVGAVIVTSGIGMGRYDLYMRANSADDLSRDTRIVLQGLPIGRVKAIYPLIDSATGGVSVLARLSVDRRFPDGTPLQLPVGTRGVIVQRNPIAAPVVQLELPTHRVPTYLQPADTIASERPANVLDVLGDIAFDLRGELTATLEDTRRLLVRTTTAVGETQQFVDRTGQELRGVLTQLAGSLERSDQLLADLSPRARDLTDSVAVTLSDTRRLLHALDSLAGIGQEMAVENRAAIRGAIEHLHRSAVVLEHFTDKVSRRPVRLFTGVTPPVDSVDPHP